MTVSTPFSAPAWPPETGASTKPKPRSFACALSSRAISAEAVVWSTKTAPFFTPWKAPFGPSVTSRRSLSLPTQHMTKSWPSAAALGVAALRPPCCATHFCALAAVRLYTVTSWPPLFLRCPAMGYPMTPRPRKATFAIPSSLEHCHATARMPICGSDCDGAARTSTVITLTRPARPLWCRFAMIRAENGAMAVTKEEVLANLAGVASPQGIPLPETGALSEVVAGDGKVFFSITVDAADVKPWEPGRKRAEELVRALPGVQSALVAL